MKLQAECQSRKLLLISNNIKIIKCSNYYETYSWPNKNFPKYLNIVIKTRTSHKISSLFFLIKFIEKKLGRKKTKKNYPRICDIEKDFYIRTGSYKISIDYSAPDPDPEAEPAAKP